MDIHSVVLTCVKKRFVSIGYRYCNCSSKLIASFNSKLIAAIISTTLPRYVFYVSD